MCKGIVINVNLLYTWKNKFLPVGITSNVLQYKCNLSKQKGYAINLASMNFENKLYQVFDITGLDDSGCLSGYLYKNANNTWEHLTTKLVSTLANHKNSGTSIDLLSEAPVFTYLIKGLYTIFE